MGSAFVGSGYLITVYEYHFVIIFADKAAECDTFVYDEEYDHCEWQVPWASCGC